MKNLGIFTLLLTPLFVMASYSEVDLRQNATYHCVDMATDKHDATGPRESIEPFSYQLSIKDHQVIVEGGVSFTANASNGKTFHLEKSGAYLKSENATLFAQVSDNQVVYFLSHSLVNNAESAENYQFESAGTCIKT